VTGAGDPALLPDAGTLLDDLEELTLAGGERDADRLARFAATVAALRQRADSTPAFRARVASAAGWAALLFSSWRHRKYDRPDITGAERVRQFVRRDLADARLLAAAR
jgi:hypothetical protein